MSNGKRSVGVVLAAVLATQAAARCTSPPAAAASPRDPAAPSATRPPNVVIIFTDDLGYGDVGVHGAKHPTPHIDRMAREGIRFTDFHVAQPVCSASRAALLTGCYPNRIGIHGALGPRNSHGIHHDETTLAELLKSKNYATGIVGKWHLGHHPQFLPTRHGFDEYFGLPYSNDMWPHHPEAQPGIYPPLPLIDNDRVAIGNVTAQDQTQLTRWYTERAVQFVARHKDEPFFLYVAHSMPHVPLFVSDRFAGKSGHGLYGDVIMEIDWSVGEVLGALAAHGLDRNTLVVFSSDNGPWLSYGNHAGSAGPLREGKGTVWEGGTRVPCIARWPGTIPADAVCNELAMTIDLFPTIAHIAGAELPQQRIDGRDILPLLTGAEPARNPHDAYLFYYGQNELQAVRSGPWKLVLPHTYRTLGGRPGGSDGTPAKYAAEKLAQAQLFHVANDMGETMNVADQYPEVTQQLTRIAEQAREELGDALTGRKGSGNRAPGRVAAP